MPGQKRWIYSPPKAPKPKIPSELKSLVQQKFEEFIETDLKPNCLEPEPTNPRFNYLVDIFGKWYRSYFYICGTYNCPGPNALSPSFEVKYARFEYAGDERFHIAYMRHTGQFWGIFRDRTLDECLEEVRTNPLLRPH